MTTQELIDYYTNLLIFQYRDKPKARATVALFVTAFIMDQLPLAVEQAFNVDTAIGTQLDILGKYIGISRNVYDFTGLVTLSDSDYRKLLQFKILLNSSDGTLANIQSLIKTFLAGVIVVFDYQDMHMSYFFNSNFGTLQFAQILVKQKLLPKPMGVGLGALIYVPSLVLFGFRTYELPGFNNVGFNSYTTYNMNWPWLSYADALF